LTRPVIADYFAGFGCDIRADEFWTSKLQRWIFWRNAGGQFPDLGSVDR
jgi:hypothetical protein